MTKLETMAVITIAGVVLGFFLKRWPEFNTKAIPKTILAVAVLKNILVGTGVLPREASLANLLGGFGDFGEVGLDGVSLAGFDASILHRVFSLGLSSWFEASLVVGTHSILKNMQEGKGQPFLRKAKR